ncbi:hypothetical protein [Anaerosacchariphilus polymeriproducens]|uniref:hypothetical protein n=1 Tax=Anaerosacchariphilus polymeriproducens TaxID=1812858 RepID=UPI0011C02F4F|nr:hypothetical protein [Anaerosacchariphilus polymeriproducens]
MDDKSYWSSGVSLLKGVTGKYFNEHDQIISSGKYTNNPEAIDKAIELTFHYIKRGENIDQ